VIVRRVGSPAVDKVAVAEPLASVVPFATAIPPELAVNVTGTWDTRLLLTSRTNAVIVALADPSDGIVGTLLTTLIAAAAAALDTPVTWTATVDFRPPEVAVTVIVRGVGSPAVERVAFAAPLLSVVPLPTAMPPEDAENVTATPEIRLFDASRASTVMAAVVEPSDRIDCALLVAVMDAAVAVVPPPPGVVPLHDEAVAAPPVTRPQPLSPPQPLRARVTKKRAIIEASVRMVLYSNTWLRCCCD
jgi:hypothetical protein